MNGTLIYYAQLPFFTTLLLIFQAIFCSLQRTVVLLPCIPTAGFKEHNAIAKLNYNWSKDKGELQSCTSAIHKGPHILCVVLNQDENGLSLSHQENLSPLSTVKQHGWCENPLKMPNKLQAGNPSLTLVIPQLC